MGLSIGYFFFLQGLQDHLNKFSENFDQVLAFKPTGWTYSDSCCSLEDIKPQTRGKITIYGIRVAKIQCIWLCVDAFPIFILETPADF